MADGRKTCLGCGEEQPVTNFRTNRTVVCADPVDASDWIVDHDHSCCPGERSCGKCVRGLLDQKCNTMIGMARDNVATLTRAQIYLEVSDGADS